MADRIERIGRVSFDTGRVEPVRRYTPEERAAKIKEIEINSILFYIINFLFYLA